MEGGEPSSAQQAAQQQASPEQIAEGQRLFTSTGNCAVCHGQNAQGGPLGPSLTDDDWIWVRAAEPLEPQLVEIIRRGVPQPREHPAPMPPMGGANLNDSQLQALAAYIASL